MKKILPLAVITGLSFSLFGCEPDAPNANAIQSHMKPAIKNTDLAEYVPELDKDVTFLVAKDKKADEYRINIDIKGDSNFSSLDLSEKFNVLASSTDSIANSKYFPRCEENTCTYGELTVKTSDGEKLKMNINNKYNEPVLYANGTSYKESDFFSTGENSEESNPSVDAFTSTSSNTFPAYINDDEVFQYIYSLYDDFLSKDEESSPEDYVPQVTKAVAKKFGISEQEALDIYVSKSYISAQ